MYLPMHWGHHSIVSAKPHSPELPFSTLLAAGIISAGHKVLSVEYKGNVTWGDLNAEGQIAFKGVGIG